MPDETISKPSGPVDYQENLELKQDIINSTILT